MTHYRFYPLRSLAAGAAILSAGHMMALDPVPDPDAVVVAGNARFTVLTPEMIRIEYSDKGEFEDRATFVVQNRRMPVIPKFTSADDGDWLTISTDRLDLRYRKGTDPRAGEESLTITMRPDSTGLTAVWYPGKPDPLNLKGTTRTLDSSNADNKRAEMEDGLISRSGWAVIDDSWSATRPDGSRSFALEPDDTVGYDWWAERKDPDALDLYFLGYGHDYKRALGDFTGIAGKIPLPPDYVFGYWYSRYASYSADDYRRIMDELAENDIPTDVMILDMDWHWNGDKASMSEDRGGWTGWSFNTNLIPDPEGLLREIHDRDYHLALNLHPADGVNAVESPGFFAAMEHDLNGKYTSGDTIKWSLDYPDFTKSLFDNVIHPHERTGVDFWWLDWQQYLTSPSTPGLGETFWCNHVFFNDMARNRKDRRPVIFHRWGGLGSHRYQIGFSGDAFINFPTMAFQPYFTATSSNVGYTYWGHDLGGHMISDEESVNDPEMMARWMQFGVFTPIFRSHATKDGRIERRIWKLPNLPQLRDAVHLRYRLFPYIYTMARKTYDTGVGICRPLYYEYPEAEEAYTHEGEYFFGDDILVAPVTEAAGPDGVSEVTVWLPEGNWWSVSTDTLLSGPGERTLSFTLDQIPYFYRQGAVVPLNLPEVRNVTARPSAYILDVVSGADGTASLYEDGGDNPDYAENFAVTPFRHTFSPLRETLEIGPREGTQAGLPAERGWQVRLLDAPAPDRLTLDGRLLSDSAWSYDASRHLLSVSLPEAPATESRRLDIEYRQ
ncbi:MAG: DUF5110 domain-containing protein [Bacteroides sp.]|nr:DUF5110 domain-containing protein [Bacteroides sp.]